MLEPLVVADHISRCYGTGGATVAALHDASCVIYPGQRIALVGPSGSGKSTLLHVLGGLDEPSSGVVSWPTLGPREQLRPGQVTDIFQGGSLLAPLSVIENVCFPLVLEGLHQRGALDLAERMLARFGVAELRDKLPEEISGGQAQRVAIARALAGRPALVLADEPTGQLDSDTAAWVLDTLLKRLDEVGAGLVIATHDERVAERIGQVWTMHDGYLASEAGVLCSTAPGSSAR